MLFLIAGLGLTVVGVALIINYIRITKSCTESVYGTVVGYEISKSRSVGPKRRWTTFYCPKISYSVKGVDYNNKSSIGRETPQYVEGEKLEIKYNPNNPEKFYIVKDKSSEKGLMLLLFLLGLCFAWFGVIYTKAAPSETSSEAPNGETAQETQVAEIISMPPQSYVGQWGDEYSYITIVGD